jgi:hypothetical protein
MTRVFAWTAVALGVAAALTTSACAHAEPEPAPPGPAQTTAPQSDTSCAESLAGALTPADAAQLGNNRRMLQCKDGTWQPFADAYPSSDRWLTTGPEVIVHGQGRRNPEAKAGTWIATPQTEAARCTVEVVDVVTDGRTSQPETSTADPGQSLTFEISDHLFTMKLGGYCLWQRS